MMREEGTAQRLEGLTAGQEMGHKCHIKPMKAAVVWRDRTELSRSALALACLKRGSSFVMVYWCIVCSVSALYAD